MEKYIVKDGKKLRYGYTTGSCATAAAKAATRMLITGQRLEKVSISTPKGWPLSLEVKDVDMKTDRVICAIVKDSGDDPDITNGIKIFAQVEKKKKAGIELLGGEGIGKVTKPGLPVSVGAYAINPVPRKMILEEVANQLPEGVGVKVTIFVPKGREIAKKTFNPRLGIVGGISILGTTGIVEPMSEEAFKESLAIELSMLREQGIKRVIFSLGNYGRDFVRTLGLEKKHLVKTSNFVGYMMDKALEYGIEEILWVGHIGKMIKVAGGIFHTHSKIADGRMEILTAHCALHGANQKLIHRIMDSNTTEEAVTYIFEDKLEGLFEEIAEKISFRCRVRTHNQLRIGTIIFSQSHGWLGSCSMAKEIVEGYAYE